jgi:hypothetical protein
MGRFSPSVPLQPSWTNSLAEGVQGIGQALMQRRAFDQQKLQQNREFDLQQQNQNRENAMAGYTPAQPYGANTASTPEGLARISNAGISDAGTPASYDPRASLTYALMNGRNMAAQQRVETQVEGRHQDVIQRGVNTDNAIGLKYGTMGPNGYQAGVVPQASIFQRAPALQQKDQEFQQREGDRAAALGEQIRYHTGQLGLGAGRNAIAGQRAATGGRGGASGGPTPTSQMSAYNQEMTRLQKPHMEPIKDPKNPNGPAILSGLVDGISYDSANVIATKHAQDRAKLFNTQGPTSHIPIKSTDAPNTPPETGNVKTLDSGRVTDQHTNTVSTTIPSGPTAPNVPDYTTAAQHYKEVESAIRASNAPDKLQRLATLRARYNADVAKIGAPQK